MRDFGLYAIITAPVLSYEQVARICVSEGVGILQIREKQLTDRELLAACERILAITRGTSTRFVVNDRADIAAICGADGVHLGQDDIPIEEARKLLNSEQFVGLSTHSIAQAHDAIARGADYIGFGPIYPTPTKAVPDPTVGVELLREVVAFSPVPVVAIGGIDLETLPAVKAAGARNYCAVRYLMQSPDLAERIAACKSI